MVLRESYYSLCFVYFFCLIIMTKKNRKIKNKKWFKHFSHIIKRVMLYARLISPTYPPICDMTFKITIGFEIDHYYILI
jgi:hypothetical protein